MLILLPPSEGKATEGDGPSLDLAGLSFPELTRTRKRVLRALTKASARKNAQKLLELPAGQAEAALARNKALNTAPTLPVARLYTGVLYDNLALHTLDEETAAQRIVILSGLWGALRLTDRIPPYRLAMGVSLPPLGRLAATWRPALKKALHPTGLVVDMRSAPYAAAWRPPSPSVTVRVFREHTQDGVTKRTVVSHMAKATRGKLAHDLIKTGEEPESPGQLLKAVNALGYTAELNEPNLDVILHG